MTTNAPLPQALLPTRLVSGYETFLRGRFQIERDRFQMLADSGQSPPVMVISCCDSRVAPEVIFDCSPGEMFVLRNVASLVPPYCPNNDFHGTSAALEFGVMGLRVEHIVVIGHALCGGVKAYIENEANPYARPLSPGDFIGSWIKLIAPAAETLGGVPMQPDGAFVESLAMQSIRQTLENLRTFPWISNLETRGLLSLHGAFFDVASGQLSALDPGTRQFLNILPEAHQEAFETPRF